MAKFNIDEMKSGFEPVDITFREAEYRLGATALSILQACELHAGIEDQDGLKYMAAFMELLPELMGVLCPDIPTDNLETGEQFALMRVCTEVLGRIGRLTFSAEDAE